MKKCIEDRSAQENERSMILETEIYYFTGTGNTLAAAKILAEKTGGKLIPIASLMGLPSVKNRADAAGVVYPVYYAGPPAVVKEFLAKIKPEGDPYMFAVATFGGSAGLSFKILKETAWKNGFELDACFGIHMPQNAFKKPFEKPDKVLARAGKRAEAAAQAVLKRKTGVFADSAPLELMMKAFNKPIRNASQKAIAGFAGKPAGMEFDALIRLSDNSFEATDACSACGLCAKVCPAGNIEMRGGRPVWHGRCENCLACAHWCPRRAIHGGVVNEYCYRHPDLTLKDMEAQRSGR